MTGRSWGKKNFLGMNHLRKFRTPISLGILLAGNLLAVAVHRWMGGDWSAPILPIDAADVVTILLSATAFAAYLLFLRWSLRSRK